MRYLVYLFNAHLVFDLTKYFSVLCLESYDIKLTKLIRSDIGQNDKVSSKFDRSSSTVFKVLLNCIKSKLLTYLLCIILYYVIISYKL